MIKSVYNGPDLKESPIVKNLTGIEKKERLVGFNTLILVVATASTAKSVAGFRRV